MNMKFNALLFSLLLMIGIGSFPIVAQGLSPHQIDSVVAKSMETFNVPGMAVSVIKDGEIILEKTYGIRSIETEKPVDKNTIFGVASNTKAFKSAALAKLVDEGVLEWLCNITI